MALTATICKNASPKEKLYRLSDGRGLYLEVHPRGARYWRYRYQLAGKSKMCSLGVFPETSLLDARDALDEARRLVKQGIDPSTRSAAGPSKAAELVPAIGCFEDLAKEWIAHMEPSWSARYAKYVKKRLELHIYPHIGAEDAGAIGPVDLLQAIRVVESAGANETAHKVYGYVDTIFQYGIATGRLARNPASDIRGALQSAKSEPRAHLSAKELPGLLKKLDDFDGRDVTRLAALFLIYTFVRTSEMRMATWDEFDFEKKLWTIPKERMKMTRAHLVPLSSQVIALLEAVRPLTGSYDYIFPNYKNPLKPMSENAVLYALYRMGYHGKATGHGFRHTASTILNEQEFNSDAIEMQLAHVPKGVRGTYNHALYLSTRRMIMQWWGDYLDGLRRVEG